MKNLLWQSVITLAFAIGWTPDATIAQDTPPASAAVPAAVETPPSAALEEETEARGAFSEFWDAFSGGAVKLNLRLRAEIVEQDATDTAQAYTERLRLGYETAPFHGLSLLAEFEDTRAASHDLYNAAGLNDQANKAIVADPENTELNQFLLRYNRELMDGDARVGAVLGRQRLTLDDHRFIGNVGWRQNEQTLDAYTLSATIVEKLSLLYSYVDDVNTIFGPDANRDLETDAHLLHASYGELPNKLGKVTVFAYFLDVTNNPVFSSNSVGALWEGAPFTSEDGLALGGKASYAYQVDSGNNPVNYEASYFLIEGYVALDPIEDFGPTRLGVGYELLGSDNEEAAFQTPLATLHAFNGWADVFLVTPDDGLEDLYLHASTSLPWDLRAKAVYHFFFSDEGSADYGDEFDASLGHKLNSNVSLLAKMAVFFDGNRDVAGLDDRQKYWLQMEVNF